MNLMVAARVDIDGLKPLLRDLRRVEQDLPKVMRQEMRPISKMVLTGATRQAQSLGGVHRHAVRRGLKAGATQSTAWIKLLAAREPTILGAEFGGGRRPTTRQFPPWRGSGSNAGYFVYPTIRGESDNIMRRLEHAVRDLLRRAGFR